MLERKFNLCFGIFNKKIHPLKYFENENIWYNMWIGLSSFYIFSSPILQSECYQGLFVFFLSIYMLHINVLQSKAMLYVSWLLH